MGVTARDRAAAHAAAPDAIQPDPALSCGTCAAGQPPSHVMAAAGSAAAPGSCRPAIADRVCRSSAVGKAAGLAARTCLPPAVKHHFKQPCPAAPSWPPTTPLPHFLFYCSAVRPRPPQVPGPLQRELRAQLPDRCAHGLRMRASLPSCCVSACGFSKRACSGAGRLCTCLSFCCCWLLEHQLQAGTRARPACAPALLACRYAPAAHSLLPVHPLDLQASSPVTTAGTPPACRPTPPPSLATARLRSSMPAGPCLVSRTHTRC